MADNFSLTIPKFDRSAFTFGLQAMGQTDPLATGLNSFTMAAFFDFFGVF
jgi:hypothetical protein